MIMPQMIRLYTFFYQIQTRVFIKIRKSQQCCLKFSILLILFLELRLTYTCGYIILPFCLALPLGSYSSLFLSAITDRELRDDHLVGDRRTLFSVEWAAPSLSKLQIEEISWGIKCGPHFLRLGSSCIKWKLNFSIAHYHLLLPAAATLP